MTGVIIVGGLLYVLFGFYLLYKMTGVIGVGLLFVLSWFIWLYKKNKRLIEDNQNSNTETIASIIKSENREATDPVIDAEKPEATDPAIESEKPETTDPVIDAEKPEATDPAIEADKQRFQRIRASLSGFRRPDPGPAYPGSYDNGESYRLVYGKEIAGKFYETRADIIHLGCVSVFDYNHYDGKHDYIAIDVITGEPWYIVDSQNGGIADFCIHGGKPISYEMVNKLAEASDSTEYIDISAENWITKLPESAKKMRAELQSVKELWE